MQIELCEATIPQLDKKRVQVNNNDSNETLTATAIFAGSHKVSWLSDDGNYRKSEED